MSLKKIFTGTVLAVGVLASNLTSFAASAQASDWGHRGRGHYRPVAPHYRHGGYAPQHGYQHERRDRSGKAVGAAILGIGALIIGAAIADSARRDRKRVRDDDDE
jgi:hypothetical protein